MQIIIIQQIILIILQLSSSHSLINLLFAFSIIHFKLKRSLALIIKKGEVDSFKLCSHPHQECIASSLSRVCCLSFALHCANEQGKSGSCC
jgi:hypothetical protein